MVAVPTKDAVRARFATRLNELLEERGVPVRGRRQWLARQFPGAFTPETVRKWLEAETIPDQAHLSMICTAFGWSVDYLMTGLGPKYVTDFDPRLAEIINMWPRLDEDGRRLLLRSARNERDLQSLRPVLPAIEDPLKRKSRT